MNFSNFPTSDSFVKIGGYAEDIEDLRFYEFFKLLASDEISDAVEVFLYKYVNPSKAKEQIGKYLQSIILVYDELERFKQLDISVDENLINVVTAYVYNKDESGINYIPFSLNLNSNNPESSFTIDELNSIPNTKYTEVPYTFNYIGGENESIRVTFEGEEITYKIYKYIDEKTEYRSEKYIIQKTITDKQFDINFNEFDYGTYVVNLLFKDSTEAYYRVNKTKK